MKKFKITFLNAQSKAGEIVSVTSDQEIDAYSFKEALLKLAKDDRGYLEDKDLVFIKVEAKK
jgi:hypothetical protein